MASVTNGGASGRTVATTSTMYRHENGRTYHAYRGMSTAEYWQPNDSKQNNAEAILHHICLMTLEDRLYLAPIGSSPRRILDVGELSTSNRRLQIATSVGVETRADYGSQGTGTGIWATDMADKFANAQVIGTDLSPVPPGMQPDNVTFEVDDCCSAWVYPENHFDFVHIRGLFGSIADWPKFYKEAYRHLRPGGHIEQIEWSVHVRSADGTLSPSSVLAQWPQTFVHAGRLTGKTFEIAENMAGLIREAGFVEVVEKRFKWPVGPWSSDPKLKEIGKWNLLSWEEGMEGWVMAAYTRVLGVSRVEDGVSGCL